MPRLVKYTKPRKINFISVTVTLLIGMCFYLVYLYGPILLLEQESKRVLGHYSQRFLDHRAQYTSNEGALNQLKIDMTRQIRTGGILDPNLEVWIEESEESLFVFGVVYSHLVPYPFDLSPPVERVVQQEIRLEVK